MGNAYHRPQHLAGSAHPKSGRPADTPGKSSPASCAEPAIAPSSVIDRAHRFTFAKQAYLERFHAAEPPVGLTIRDILPLDCAEAMWQAGELAFRQNDSAGDESPVEPSPVPSGSNIRQQVIQVGAHSFLVSALNADGPSGIDSAPPHALHDADERPGHLQREIQALGMHRVRFGFIDPLTQLPNRRAMSKFIDQLTSQPAASFVIAVLNIDNFRLVNDRFGYAAGDTVILELIGRFHERILDGSVSLGRLDNDEFILVIECSDHSAADFVVENVKAACAQAIPLGNYNYHVSFTTGVATYPAHGTNADTLIRNANLAMRWSKRNQRGGSQIFSTDVRRDADRQASVELKLPDALASKSIELHYQPIVSRANREVIGYEALLRWEDPLLGVVEPSEFVPVAEHMGLIGALGHYCLDAAVSFAAAFPSSPCVVAVNVSGSQLLDETFPIAIAEILQHHNVSGEQLVLEITESVAMREESYINQVLLELAAMGVKLFVDDFGTGFSNFSRLKSLPVAGVKIDREFIRDLPGSARDEAIFEAACSVARAMELITVVEGVEDADQEAYVTQFDVNYLQGFRFGVPQPREIILAEANYRAIGPEGS